MSVETKIAKLMANDAPLCNLSNLSKLLDKMRFTKKFKVITIAGTNGKGTAVAMLEQLFVANNKTFLSHTSPHVFKFNERISLVGYPISDSYLLELLERVGELTLEYKLSYYQIAFLCVCLCSQREFIDYLILEVGIGGRLDAVNLIDADLSAITNIDFDHCEILGDTLDKIGVEKAGISRKYKPLFLGSKMPDSVYEYASDIGAVIYDNEHSSSLIDCFHHSYNISMSIAEYLLRKRQISYITKIDHIKAFGRCSVIKNDVKNNSYIVVDVAHNPASVEHLFKILSNKFKHIDIKYEAIFGLLKGKDLGVILSIAKKHIHKWDVIDLVCFDYRAANLSDIKQEFRIQGLVRVDYHNCLESIYLSKKNTVTVVFGSFVLVGEFIKKYDTSCM